MSTPAAPVVPAAPAAPVTPVATPPVAAVPPAAPVVPAAPAAPAAGPLASALGADPKAAAPVAVDYDKLDLKKPEGYKGADTDLAFARNMAKSLGLSAEAAQKFVDEHAKVIAADDEAITREQAQTRSDNIATLKADAEFGGAKFNESIARADQWLAKYDPNGDLNAELKAFGLDSHPTLVRAIMRAARDMADGTTFVQAKPGDSASQAASLSEFYPSMK